MPKKKADQRRVPDVELEKLVQRALDQGITLTRITAEADINQATLWRWRQGIYSPVMRERQRVVDTIHRLIEGSQ